MISVTSGLFITPLAYLMMDGQESRTINGRSFRGHLKESVTSDQNKNDTERNNSSWKYGSACKFQIRISFLYG